LKTTFSINEHVTAAKPKSQGKVQRKSSSICVFKLDFKIIKILIIILFLNIKKRW